LGDVLGPHESLKQYFFELLGIGIIGLREFLEACATRDDHTPKTLQLSGFALAPDD
jgi:hypothetical protein